MHSGPPNEEQFMRRALEIATAVDRAAVTPNPRVGAVIVRDGELIGEGAHERLGGLHAERAALLDCESRGHGAEGATMYVTLEPCAHEGKQPPCAEAIVAASIARVVVASGDPSSKADGTGPAFLRDHRIEVDVADADSEEAAVAQALNQPFRKHSRTGLPLVALKVAASFDGRAAASSGDSKWISSEPSRELGHRWRAGSDAVAVGIGTALADDPLLTARDVDAPRQPLRIVFDSNARLPLGSKLLATLDEAPVLVITSENADADGVEALRAGGADVFAASGATDGERLSTALTELGARKVTSLLVDGGPTLASAFLEAGEADVVLQFVAPLLLGGDRTAISAPAAPTVRDALRAHALSADEVGTDVLLTARLREW